MDSKKIIDLKERLDKATGVLHVLASDPSQSPLIRNIAIYARDHVNGVLYSFQDSLRRRKIK